MIYKKNLLEKELNVSFFEHSISLKHLECSLFIALISFSIYLILQTLTKSVLVDVFPKYMNQSYYSTLIIYKDFFYVSYIIYFATHYHFLTFDEIRSNKWYIPFKFGFSLNKMIFTKLIARMLTVFIIYGTGYLITIFFTSLLKYPLMLEYIIPIFILGLIDVNFTIIVTMTSSLYYKKGIISNYIMLFSILVLSVLKFISGYFDITNNKSNFNSIKVLSKFSAYISILAIISSVCVFIIFVRGKSISKYFFFSFGEQDYELTDDVKITLLSDSKFEKVPNYKFYRESNVKTVNNILSSFIVIVITILIVLNIIVLLITIATTRKEVSIFNIIPYVFQSDTMEPSIKYNDLVFFKESTANEIFNGDIVIYKANEQVNIARIESFQSDNVTVDVDNYPYHSESGVYRETINKNQIYGKYMGRSRWLGLLVLFANSTVGRLFLLFIPIVLLFYYKEIIDLLNYIIKKNIKE